MGLSGASSLTVGWQAASVAVARNRHGMIGFIGALLSARALLSRSVGRAFDFLDATPHIAQVQGHGKR